MTKEKTKERKNKPSLSEAIILSDIDYTLIDFDLGHQAGIKALATELGEDIGRRTHELFMIVLQGLRVKSRDDWKHVPGGEKTFKNLMRKMEDLQPEVIAKYQSPKVWSREIWIYLAAQELGINMTPDEVNAARDIYWQAVKQSAQPYQHALDFFTRISKLDRPVYLHTGSDSILKMSRNQFYYDPDFSHKYKLNRLRSLGTAFPHKKLFIGDHIDKYSPEFARHMIQTILEHEKLGDPSRIIAIGDSYQSDVKWPLEFGAGAGFFLRPDYSPKQEGCNLFTVSALTDIKTLLS